MSSFNSLNYLIKFMIVILSSVSCSSSMKFSLDNTSISLGHLIEDILFDYLCCFCDLLRHVNFFGFVSVVITWPSLNWAILEGTGPEVGQANLVIGPGNDAFQIMGLELDQVKSAQKWRWSGTRLVSLQMALSWEKDQREEVTYTRMVACKQILWLSIFICSCKV